MKTSSQPVKGTKGSETIYFESYSQASKNGYSNIRRSIQNNRLLKGWKFEAITFDEYAASLAPDPEPIRTVEESLKEESTGLGDTVAKILHSPILKPLTEAVKGLIWKDGDCGCNERLAELNKFVKYRKNKPVRFFTKHEFDQLSAIQGGRRIQAADVRIIIDLHSSIFAHTKPAVCGGCSGSSNLVFGYLDDLQKLKNTVANA